MPVPTVEQLEKMEASLKKVIAEQGETTEAAKRRATKKKLHRVQRKRRRFVALATARAKAQPKPAAEASKSAESKPEPQPTAEKSEDPKVE